MAIIYTLLLVALHLYFTILRPVTATNPENIDVFSPTITYPTAGVVWHVGSIQAVTWKTSNIPHDVLENPGMVLLGHLANGSENLNIESPLASGFRLRAGSVHVVVPKVEHRSDYVVVLLGDSGNTSPKFVIASGPMI